IALANGTAGNAVVFAGSTVLIALLALNVTGIPFLGLMGSLGAFCVLIAVLVSVTLTPAVLGLLGERVLNRRGREIRFNALLHLSAAEAGTGEEGSALSRKAAKSAAAASALTQAEAHGKRS